MWRLQDSGAIFVCVVSVKLRLLFTAGPYWQVVWARCAVWIFIDLWNLRPQNACSLSFLRPALKICVKNADFCVNANPAVIHRISRSHRLKNWQFESSLSNTTRPVAAIKSLRFALFLKDKNFLMSDKWKESDISRLDLSYGWISYRWCMHCSLVKCRTSAGTMMTKFKSCKCGEWLLNG